MKYVAGRILFKNGFHKGYLCFDKQGIVDVGKGVCPQKPVAKGLITPSFINSHTHIGDTFVRKKNVSLPHDLKKLVAPPDGLKHRLLKTVSENEIKQGMKTALEEMMQCGISMFFDFRENGVYGAKLLVELIKNTPIKSYIFGRPDKLRFDKNELSELGKIVDGIGLSSITDWQKDELKLVVDFAEKYNLPVSLHASERIREDINMILSLNPTFLTHMTKATKKDLEKVKQFNIPIVICPRSNAFFGQLPPLQLMKKVGVDLLLGTDNAMLHSLTIQDEIRFIRKKFQTVFSLETLLIMATYNPRKALNLKDDIPRFTFPTPFLVLDPKTLQPIYKSING